MIVSVAGLARRRAQKIVGTAVFPTGLGTGAALTVAGLRGLGRRACPSRPPTALVNFGQVQSLPLLLGICLGLLALLTIAHLLITSVRRWQRDLARLRTIGFTRRQVRQTVAW